jgi:hypothetical protein
MAGVFNVYLKNLVPSDQMNWGEGDMYQIGLYIKQYFDEVCQNSNSTFSSADFWWDPANGAVKSHELLVYFLKDSSESLIHKTRPSDKINLNNNGNTLWRSDSTPRISEIYVNSVLIYNDAHLLLAKLAFHELMHNKLEKFDVHGGGGGGLATGSPITSSTPLTDKNKELMAKALAKKVPQYQGAL